MMKYFEKLLKAGMISESWRGILSVLLEQIDSSSNDAFGVIIATYFSLIDDGNVYMSLDSSVIDAKFSEKIEGLKIQFAEADKDSSLLDEIYDEFKNALPCLKDLDKLSFVSKKDEVSSASKSDDVSSTGEKGLFIINDDKLFTRKYFNAKETVLSRFGVLFDDRAAKSCTFDYKKYVKPGFNLSPEQEEVITKGYYNNLLVTGGPGTGKTTSIFFLLLPLIMDKPDAKIYLAAPSGKAASRMKESILSSVGLLDESVCVGSAAGGAKAGADDFGAALEKIRGLQESTIHRLLEVDYNNGGFKKNKNNQFGSGSIFVIDEASMIDLPLFASLLEAIPDDARVFILGDKDQLPSVGVGAVYGELLKMATSVGSGSGSQATGSGSQPANAVSLVKSQRFPEDSEIFKLAAAVNAGDPSILPLPVSEDDWMDVKDFEIEDGDASRKNPIYYYSDDFSAFSQKTGMQKESAMIERVCSAWFEKYFDSLKAGCKDLPSPGAESLARFENIFSTLEDARILSANNVGVRGVNSINQMLLKKYFSPAEKIAGYFPGEPLMITENLRTLDLYNGDSGVAVTFACDETIYIMFKKTTSLTIDTSYTPNQIFALGSFVFYPARLIGRDFITTAYAITIHKSQGSDYGNILVILPRLKGHPLLNRQIVYTAITRTKGATYILSNQENLAAASETLVQRDTM